MATDFSKFTTAPLALDSFLFRKRGLLSKKPGTEWNGHVGKREILTALNFQLQEEPDGTKVLRFRHTATAKDGG